MPYEFLSDDWLTEVKKITEELGGDQPASDLNINIVVTGGPSGDRQVHINGTTFGAGNIEGAPTKLTVPFDVAKAIFVEGNQQAAMQAFMGGQIKVEGDMSKLMAMQSQGGSPNPELSERIKSITEA
jgi:putative sterol carrier protein